MEQCEGKQTKMSQKPKGGRPKKKVTRESHLMVRLTHAERFLIEGKAKEAGMKPSEWFRQAARKAWVVARLSPEDLSLLRTVTGMANNLNQLAKKAHSEGLLTIHRKCTELLNKIEEFLNYCRKDDREDT